MKHDRLRSVIRYAVFCLLLFTFHFSLFTAVSAQRDYFTPEEVEMIRDAQQIDMRVDVLTKIIDRRFAMLGIDAGGAKIPAKDDKWGTLAGSRPELFFDIKRILQKAIDDIDNLSERPDSMVVEPMDPKGRDKKPKSFGDIFPKAVRSLAAAATRWKPPLTAALDATKDQKERGSILDSIEMCDEVIAAVAKLPAEVKKAKH